MARETFGHRLPEMVQMDQISQETRIRGRSKSFDNLIHPLPCLTPRELDVLRIGIEGDTLQETAQAINPLHPRSVKTVEYYRASVKEEFVNTGLVKPDSGFGAVMYAAIKTGLVKAPDKPQIPLKDLSEREIEVLKLVARGLTNLEIADTLFICAKTVEKHKQHITEKTGARQKRRFYLIPIFWT